MVLSCLPFTGLADLCVSNEPFTSLADVDIEMPYCAKRQLNCSKCPIVPGDNYVIDMYHYAGASDLEISHYAKR